jgi:hypothetical protein
MTRFLLRSTLCALAAIGVAALLALVQLSDNQQLRGLLADNCLASCFMGIRPGVTTVEEAKTLLETHPWVDQVIMIKDDDPYQMAWTWSDKAPDFLKNAPTNAEHTDSGRILFHKGIASNIGFSTDLTFGDIALAWHYPEDAQLLFPALIIAPDSSVLAAISVEYQDFRVRGTLYCPYSAHIWQTPVFINVMDKSNLIDVSNTVPIGGQNFLGRIRKTSRIMCNRRPS